MSRVGIVIAAACVGSVLAFAALAKTSKKAVKPAVAVLERRKEFDQYLTQMRSYLQTPPRDGVFGADRIPNIHGKFASEIPAFKTIQSFQGKIQVRSAVIGFNRVKYTKVSDPEDQLPDNTDPVRITPVHLLTPDKSLTHNAPNLLYDDGADAFSAAWKVGSDSLRQAALKLQRSHPESFSEAVSFRGQPAWILGQAVHASVDSCYKCHRDIPKGQPIGYVTALISKN